MKTNNSFNICSIGLIIFTISCAPQRIKLSKEESKLEKHLKTELNCPDLELRHDYSAITEKRNDGSFDVLLCDPFCNMDSTELKELALKITPKIIQALSHKTNYKKITCYTSIEKHTSEKSSTLTCSKTVQVLLGNPNSVSYKDRSYH